MMYTQYKCLYHLHHSRAVHQQLGLYLHSLKRTITKIASQSNLSNLNSVPRVSCQYGKLKQCRRPRAGEYSISGRNKHNLCDYHRLFLSTISTQQHCQSRGYCTEKRGTPPWRILFFGSDVFSVKILQALQENRSACSDTLVETLDVVSTKGQNSVKTYAETVGVSIRDWPIPDLTGCYDVGVLASFGYLVPGKVIRMFPHGILNVHPSLLPRWRGASPLVHTILSRDKVTGVTIMKLRPKHFDVGTVLAQEKMLVPDGCTTPQLLDVTARRGSHLLLRTLGTLSTIQEKEQVKDGVTYAHKVRPAMAYIDWDRQTMEEIQAQYRALSHMMPLRSELNGYPVKLLDMNIVGEDDVAGAAAAAAPGTVVFDKKQKILCVRCQNGWVGFENIVFKKKMSAQAFYNGYLSKVAERKLLLDSIKNGLDTESYMQRVLQRV
ncbi:methionyl-tRNA formyltransferase, mitochondrial-like isoform X1 [Haliotis rubra]|uniref:methionyl-tRNA formyltransferase, mitochondrial-like isoform X1 n=1 Tax=Haliotis rubra TaxID=36100 RepID=UPI001EE6243E|nr:methionyl-tRNA formyltransferase, mitochondrial-like isoform X1 [Haliotis rubra]XP_046550412.1 methionyl-tRNA formyltransferase, mitochondrial-like isoform X1 [Haliotis rubra]